MKIALCLSGQPRYLDEGYFFIKKYLLDKYDIDVFVHTWWDETYAGKEFGNTNLQRSCRYDSKTIDKINNYYSPKKLKYEKEKDFDFFADELFKQQNKPFDFFTDMNYGGLHPIAPYSFYYSLKICNELKCEYEKENGFIYDIVIRTRFDIVLKSFNLDLNTVNPSLFYVTGDLHYAGHSYFCSDNFAFSSSENMNFYASLFDNMSKYRDLGQGKVCFSGEGLLKGHLYDFNKKNQYFCTNHELSIVAWWQFLTNSCGSINGYEDVYNECLKFVKNLKENEK